MGRGPGCCAARTRLTIGSRAGRTLRRLRATRLSLACGPALIAGGKTVAAARPSWCSRDCQGRDAHPSDGGRGGTIANGAQPDSGSAVKARLAVAVAVAWVSLSAACRRAVIPAPWHDEAEYRWRELRVPASGGPGFAELPASRTGIHFTNSVTLDSALWNRHLAQGGGVALGDVDGDGLPDIYLTSNDGSNALYRNLGDWRFEDITARAGVAMTGRHSTGTGFADVDGDGALDLRVRTLGGGVVLFLNHGPGAFP